MKGKAAFIVTSLGIVALILGSAPASSDACSVAPFEPCPTGCVCSSVQETRTCTNSGCPSGTGCGTGHSSQQIWCGTSSDGRNEYYKTRCSLTGDVFTCDECQDGYFGAGCDPCPSSCNGPDAGQCDDGMDGDGNCNCNDGYAGDQCQYSDAETCSGNGTAKDDGSCQCIAGFTGKDCSRKASDGISAADST